MKTMNKDENRAPTELNDEELGKVSGGAQEHSPEGFFVNADACICCECCGAACPAGCIEFKGKCAVIHQEFCIECGCCIDTCPMGAIIGR